ncbi:MAG: hypothetical protein ACO2PN_29540 [Pyrobaculum sp.]
MYVHAPRRVCAVDSGASCVAVRRSNAARGAMACRPQVDPAILLHRDPRAWEELLGWGCIEAFLEGAKFVDVDSLDSLVDYSVSSPSAMRLILAGVRFSGHRGREWEDYLRGRLEMGARMKFPKVETGVRRDDVWIQISPAYMLLPFDETKRRWQRSAYTLLKYIPDIPTHYKPREIISALLPPELRALSARGYVWVASIKSRDRYNDALAEWLYWLNHARLPHIDVKMGKFEPRAPVDSLVLSRRRFVGKIGAPTLPTNQGQHV